jgi:peptidoglycan/xylan/chitin deacetylase (PgdA/CDA1 family)
MNTLPYVRHFLLAVVTNSQGDDCPRPVFALTMRAFLLPHPHPAMLRAVLLSALSCLFLMGSSAQAPVSPSGSPVTVEPRKPAENTSAEPIPHTIPPEVTQPLPPGAVKHTYSQCHVDGPFIAMTFDDGPHAENTPRLLDMLKKRDIKATFFVVGQCVAEYPAIMKRIVAEGHEVANHSWSHPLLTKMGEDAVTSQLQKTHDAIVETTGVTPKLLRPPYGGFSLNQRNWANKKWGYKIILWDVDPLDWKYRNAARVHSEIVKLTVPGSIVLSHDIHKSTVDAMPETLDALAAKGFKFVTVSELLAMDRPVAPKAKSAPATSKNAHSTGAPPPGGAERSPQPNEPPARAPNARP